MHSYQKQAFRKMSKLHIATSATIFPVSENAAKEKWERGRLRVNALVTYSRIMFLNLSIFSHAQFVFLKDLNVVCELF